jgi:type III pantothenate kinase
MLLAIDTGNTNVKFALVDDSGEIVKRWRIATDARRTADEYAVWLDQLIQMAGFRRNDIKAVVIATVVPRALHNLQLLASHYFDCEALIAGRGSVGWGIQLKVDEPQSVGADRAVNAIAAQSLADGDKLVISFGTATTFDYIGPDGSYRGGSIAPGVNLSLDALYAAAAMLPRIAIEPPPNEIATGGLAILFQQHGHLFDRVEPDLTLRGLALLYRNRET